MTQQVHEPEQVHEQEQVQAVDAPDEAGGVDALKLKADGLSIVDVIRRVALTTTIAPHGRNESDFINWAAILAQARGFTMYAGATWLTVDEFWTPTIHESVPTYKKTEDDDAADDDDDDDLDEELTEMLGGAAFKVMEESSTPQETERPNPGKFVIERMIPTGMTLHALNFPAGMITPNVETLWMNEESLVLFNRTGDLINMMVFAASIDALLRVIALIKVQFPERKRPLVESIKGRPTIPINFWFLANMGQPESATRVLEVATYDEIKGNYPANIAAPMQEMMTFTPTSAGQLFIWLGPPGTGKSWAIRTLAWEWRKWCSFHYIIDPEQLINGPATYLTRLLLHDDTSSTRTQVSLSGSMTNAKVEEFWRMIVLEDTGELIGADAKTRAGAGLSRLLNAVDGMLGQGTRTLFLITTNESIDRLHEAVTRPGRCAGQLHFPLFKRGEANAWLEREKVTARASVDTSLAVLFEFKTKQHKIATVAKRERIGFTGAVA